MALYKSMFEELFGASLKQQAPYPGEPSLGVPAMRRLGVFFGHASASGMIFGEDALGREAQLGTSVQQGKFHGIWTSGLMGSLPRGGKMSVESISDPHESKFFPGDVRGTGRRSIKDLMATKPGMPGGALFMFDTELPERYAYGAGLRPGANKLPFVPVKQMMSEFFPEFNLSKGTRVSDIVNAVYSGGPAAHFFIDSAREAGGELKDLKEQQKIQAFVGAAYARAKQQGDAGVARFKSFLAKYGVKGMTGVQARLHNPDDPYNLSRYMGDVINQSPSGIKGSTVQRAIHISGEDHLSTMVQELRGRFGREYASQFQSFAGDLYSRAGSNASEVAFLLTDEGKMFVGLADTPKRYYPLPAGQHGVITYGSGTSAAKSIYTPKKGLRTATGAFFDAFVKGAGTFGGGLSTIAEGLEKGHKYASKEHAYIPALSNRTDAVRWNSIKQPVTGLGNVALYRGVAEKNFVAFVDSPNAVQGEYYDHLYKTIGNIYARKTTEGFGAGAIEAIKRSHSRVRRTMPGIDPNYYFAIKPGKKNIAPLAAMGKYILQGVDPQDVGPRSKLLMKGMHQELGKQEIYDQRRLAGIMQSRKAGSGYQGRAFNVLAPTGEAKIQRQLTKIWGKPTTTSFPMFVGYVAGRTPQQAGAFEEVFGDAGAWLTQRGSDLFSRKAPVGQMEMMLGADDAQELVRQLGRGQTGEVWDHIRSSTKLGNLSVDQRTIALGARISEEVARSGYLLGQRIPAGAKYLTGMTYSDYMDKVTLSFASEYGGQPVVSMLAGGARMSARRVSKNNLSEFGPLSRIADIVTSEANVRSIDPLRRQLEHTTNLLGFRGYDAVSQFHEKYKALGGKGLSVGHASGTPQLRGHGLMEEDLAIMRRAMLGMGFTPRQLAGHVFGKGGLHEILPSEVMNQMPNLPGVKDDQFRLLLLSGADRARETEDVLRQSKAFSTRLETLQRVAISMRPMFSGIGLKSPMQHPGFRAEVEFLKKSGVTFQNIGPTGAMAGIPAEYARVVSPMTQGFVPEKGVGVYTLEQARERFIHADDGVNTRMFNRLGVSQADLGERRLFAPGRKGFYLQLPASMAVPVSPYGPMSGKATEQMAMVKHIYVPSAEVLNSYMGGARPVKGGLVHSIVGLMEGGMENPHSTAQIQAVYRSFANWKGTSKFLVNQLSTASVPGSAKARLIQRQASASKLLIGSSKQAANEIFTVGMSRSDINELIRSAAAGDKTIEQRLKQEFYKNKFVYGTARPTPTHGAGHQQMVKVIADQTMEAGAGGMKNIAAHPALAWFVNRDFDKDQIDFLLDAGRFRDTLNPKDIIDQQTRNVSQSVKAWRDSLAHIDRTLKTPTGLKLFETAAAHIKFGSTPSIAFAAAYGVQGFGDTITHSQNYDELADFVNKLMGSRVQRPFQAQNIKVLAQAMGGREGFEKTMLFQRNIYQALINKGADADMIVGELMSSAGNIAEEMQGRPISTQSIGRAVDIATQAAHKTLFDMTKAGADLSALKIDIPVEGTPDQVLTRLSSMIGKVYGVYGLAMASHAKPGFGFPNLLREGLSQTSSGIKGVFQMLHPEEELSLMDSPIGDDLIKYQGHKGSLGGSSQSATAAANAETKANSEVAQTATNWVRRNWKILGGAAAAVMALRGIGQTIAGGTMEAPDQTPEPLYGNAPLPRTPMVDMHHEPMVNMTPPTARIMSSNDRSYHAQGAGSYNSENIGDIASRLSINSSAIQGSYTTLNINDSRKYSSGWDTQRLASLQEDSDFIHPNQYLG